MKTIGLIVLMMFAQTAPPLPRQTAKSSGHEQSAKSENGSRDKQVSADRSAVVPLNPQTAAPHISKTNNGSAVDNDPKDPVSVNPVEVKKDRWDYIYIVANIVIALVTLILAFIAKQSASIAINAQRSWIVSDRVDTDDLNEVWINKAACHFKVLGSSPVRVYEAKIIFNVVNAIPRAKSGARPDLPEYPDYGKPDTLLDNPQMGRIYAPADPIVVVPMLDSLFLKKEDFEAFKEGKKFLVLYGFIRYRDAFAKSQKRETRFCYVYGKQGALNSRADSQFTVGGPPRYNEVT